MRRSYVFPMVCVFIEWDVVPGAALNLNSTNLPDHGHRGNLPLQGKSQRYSRDSNRFPRD